MEIAAASAAMTLPNISWHKDLRLVSLGLSISIVGIYPAVWPPRAAFPQDKAQWHRRHRRIVSARLKAQAVDFEPRSHRAQSDPWKMDKDGKSYWGKSTPASLIRK